MRTRSKSPLLFTTPPFLAEKQSLFESCFVGSPYAWSSWDNPWKLHDGLHPYDVPRALEKGTERC